MQSAETQASLKSKVVKAVCRIDPDANYRFTLDAEALPYLLEFIRGDEVGFARRAASLATWIDDPRAARVVRRAARSPHAEVRLAVATGLWRTSRASEPNVVLSLLADADPVIRRHALRSVGRMANHGFRISRPITTAMQALAARDPLPINRSLAGAVVKSVLKQSTSRQDLKLILRAGLQLHELLIVLDPTVREHLAPLASDGDAKVAIAAVSLAVAMNPTSSLDALERAAIHRRPAVRAAAARAAAAVPGCGDLLLTLTGDDDARVREAAFIAAGRKQSRGLRQVAARLATDDSDAIVREIASSFLRKRRRPFAGR